MVLVAATASHKPREGMDFLPLTAEYLEKTAAAGKIPGGYFKREGRPTEGEILTLVLSADKETPSDVLAVTGASAALTISDIHWAGPLACVRVGRVDGQLAVFPTLAELADSDMNIVVACSRAAP